MSNMADEQAATSSPVIQFNAEQSSQLLQTALKEIQQGRQLSQQQMQDITLAIMQDVSAEAQVAALLMGLSVRGEQPDELEGAVRAMRSMMLAVDLDESTPVIDIVGTGGDGASLVNISTAAALVVSAAGVKVAKHGNRSVSSRSGSADLLEAAGVALELSSQQVSQCVASLGIGFMFANMHHPAMRFVSPIRRQLGVRTLFNLMGPLSNPARVRHHVIGVYDPRWLRPVAEVLQRLGSERAWVVHSEDGLDEISLAGPTRVVALQQGELTEMVISPQQVGMPCQDLSELAVRDAGHSLALFSDALGRRKTATGQRAADMIALNAGAALYLADAVSSWKHGVALAQDVLHGGQAWEKLQNLAEFTRQLKQLERETAGLTSAAGLANPANFSQ